MQYGKVQGDKKDGSGNLTVADKTDNSTFLTLHSLDNHHRNPSKTDLPELKRQTAELEHSKRWKLTKLTSEKFGLTASPEPADFSSSDWTIITARQALSECNTRHATHKLNYETVRKKHTGMSNTARNNRLFILFHPFYKCRSISSLIWTDF